MSRSHINSGIKKVEEPDVVGPILEILFQTYRAEKRLSKLRCIDIEIKEQ